MSDVARPPLNRRALGLALTRIANIRESEPLPASIEPPESPARRIGLTGAPGAGKSTLAGRLAIARAKRGRLGILAIDPTSPKSGGAILGDRIRMDDLPGSEDLYIRSFASRSACDGLTDNLPELLETMDRFGFDEVILETVGVGQAEWAARTQVDTLVLVIPPDAGDVVQAMKAGIMEIADLYAVNKSDLPSAAKMAAEIKQIVALTRRGRGDWRPPIILTSASNPGSIVQLSEQIDRHVEWLRSSGGAEARMLERRKYRLRRWFERRIHAIIEGENDAFFELPPAEQIASLAIRLTDYSRP